MPQQQCPWCGRCGERYDEGTPWADRPQPHDDESKCCSRPVYRRDDDDDDDDDIDPAGEVR